MDRFTETAAARAGALQRKIEMQMNQASIRYMFAPLFPMIVEPLSTTIEPGAIVPISEQGQPVGEVYLQTLVREGEVFDPSVYDLRNGIGEITINPAPIVDSLLSMYSAQGAVQVKSLFNLDVGRFLEYDLNDLIFGADKYETVRAYKERFATVKTADYLESFARERQKRWPADFGQLLGRVMLELEASVEVAFAWAKTEAELANQALKSGDMKRFAPREAKIFKFSGVTPIDEAMNQVALNQSALASSLPTIVTEFKEAVIASKPDYSELGKAIAAGMKDVVTDAINAARQEPTAPAKEEATKPAPAKGGNKTS
jgi:hypothetical protein